MGLKFTQRFTVKINACKTAIESKIICHSVSIHQIGLMFMIYGFSSMAYEIYTLLVTPRMSQNSEELVPNSHISLDIISFTIQLHYRHRVM